MAYYDFIYNDQELSDRAKAVYIYLKDHANKEGACWPGSNTIAAGVSLFRSTVKLLHASYCAHKRLRYHEERPHPPYV